MSLKKCSWLKRLLLDKKSWVHIFEIFNDSDFVFKLLDFGDAFIYEYVITKAILVFFGKMF
jgi:hypothetical protein